MSSEERRLSHLQKDRTFRCRLPFIVNEVSDHADGDGQCQPPFLGEITQVKDSSDAWSVKLPIQGTFVNFKIDKSYQS